MKIAYEKVANQDRWLAIASWQIESFKLKGRRKSLKTRCTSMWGRCYMWPGWGTQQKNHGEIQTLYPLQVPRGAPVHPDPGRCRCEFRCKHLRNNHSFPCSSGSLTQNLQQVIFYTKIFAKLKCVQSLWPTLPCTGQHGTTVVLQSQIH